MTDNKKKILKHIVIDIVLSIAVSVLYFFLIDNGWLNSTLVFAGSFGILMIPCLLELMFSKETDPQEFETIYYYEGYNKSGVCRVHQLFGDPDDQNNMKKSYNFLDKSGKVLFDDWFYLCTDFDDEYGVASVCKEEDGLWYVVNASGEYVTKKGYDYMSNVFAGVVKVMDEDHNVNFVDVRTGMELWENSKKELSL